MYRVCNRYMVGIYVYHHNNRIHINKIQPNQANKTIQIQNIVKILILHKHQICEFSFLTLSMCNYTITNDMKHVELSENYMNENYFVIRFREASAPPLL